MTCTSDGTVDLGQEPLSLAVYVRPGQTWSDSMVLVAVADGTETVIAWPSAPVLQFGPEDSPVVSVTGVLSEDPDSSTVDALASWSMTIEETALITAYMSARLLVDARTWLEGQVDA